MVADAACQGRVAPTGLDDVAVGTSTIVNDTAMGGTDNDIVDVAQIGDCAVDPTDGQEEAVLVHTVQDEGIADAPTVIYSVDLTDVSFIDALPVTDRPSRQSDWVGQLRHGDTLQIIETWPELVDGRTRVRILAAGGTTGWVSKCHDGAVFLK